MQHALELAKRGLGRTHPNPAVGCVILKDGKVGPFTHLLIAVGRKRCPFVCACNHTHSRWASRAS